MSISTELTRLARNAGALNADTNAIFDALRAKGVDVPANAQLSDVADMIETIVPPSSIKIGDRYYHYVQIGNQLWMTENLDLKLSGIGIGGTDFTTTSPHAWYYNNDEVNYGIDGTYKCGLLYNGYAVELLNNTSSIFPDGWHIPTQSEFNILFSFVSNDTARKLKALDGAIRSDFPSNWNGTNDYGFNFIPAGQIDESFDRIGWYGALYSCDFISRVDSGIYNAFYYDNVDVGMNYQYTRKFAISLRLVRDVT